MLTNNTKYDKIKKLSRKDNFSKKNKTCWKNLKKCVDIRENVWYNNKATSVADKHNGPWKLNNIDKYKTLV